MKKRAGTGLCRAQLCPNSGKRVRLFTDTEDTASGPWIALSPNNERFNPPKL